MRTDLYYPMNLITIHLLPLREQTGDTPFLIARVDAVSLESDYFV